MAWLAIQPIWNQPNWNWIWCRLHNLPPGWLSSQFSDRTNFNVANMRSVVFSFMPIPNWLCPHAIFVYTYCLVLLRAFFIKFQCCICWRYLMCFVVSSKYTLFSMYMSPFPILCAFNSLILRTQAMSVTWKYAGVFLLFLRHVPSGNGLGLWIHILKTKSFGSLLSPGSKYVSQPEHFLIWSFMKVMRRGLLCNFFFSFWGGTLSLCLVSVSSSSELVLG